MYFYIETSMKNIFKDLGKKGELLDVINFILLKQKYSQGNKAQAIINDPEPELEYTDFYPLIPNDPKIDSLIETIDRTDINSVKGEMLIANCSQDLVKIISRQTYSLS